MRGPIRIIFVLNFCFTFLFFLISSCVLDTFEDFSVVSVSVPKNGVIGTDKQELEIVFSKDIEKEDVKDFVRIESSSGEVTIRIKITGNTLIIYPDEQWTPFERYWLIISKNMKDVFGKELGVDFFHPFQSTKGLIPVSAVLVSPKIENGIVESEVREISILFQSDVEKNSVEREFFLSPAVDGYFVWTSGNSFRYHLLDNLEKNRLYTINISENAKDNLGYGIKSFKREFEYWPNQEYPKIENILIDGVIIYDSGNSESYTIEEGIFIIENSEAEKNPAIRIDFSSSIDKATFTSNFQVTPFMKWHEEWINNDTVVVTFEDNLLLDELYEINLSRGIKDESGLNVQYGYLIFLYINGVNSKFIKFYADEFQSLDISATLVGISGIISPANYKVIKNRDREGSYIEIEYNDPTMPKDIDIELILTLRFTHPYYTPTLNMASVQDSVGFDHIFGEGGIAAGIADFDWDTGNSNECRIHVLRIKTNNIYCFSIKGGKKGIIDELNNYLEDDITFYFQVKLTQVM